MKTHEVDVVVLGLGPGGEHAAIKLGRAGRDVVGIENRLVGGECPYFGCVPSKMMIAASNVLGQARRVPEFGGTVDVRPDWGPVAARIRDDATDDWDDTAAVERLQESGARFVRGTGTITGPGRVEVGDTTYVARRGVVLNTGTAPAVPPIEGLADTPYWTNRDVVRLTELPSSLIVIGGGAVGAELAQMFLRFGVGVSLLEGADQVMPAEEPEAGRVIAERFAAGGMQVLTGTEVASVAFADGAFTVSLGGQELSAEKLLVAAGRSNNLSGIGLDTAGVETTSSGIETDERMRAGEKLWAVGDITGKGPFTHVSMYQAAVAVRDILGEDGPWADYRAVTRVTFTAPEVAATGLSEQQAREQLGSVAVATTDLGARGWLAGEEGLVKLVADTERQVLVGATVVGPSGGEVISMLAAAVHAEIPIATLSTMHFAYPTFHRAVETALADLV